ncbi:MAG: HEPN domain-containing protein [Planctomycetota bacterium]|jgi:HEPN domain-containing protein
MSDPESNYLEWIAKAENDLLNIENNLAAERVPWDTVCFHAHQAAEKLLKAFLVQRGEMPTKTHDLPFLLRSCMKYDPDLSSLKEDCRGLNGYDATARYPGMAADEGDARRMTERARRIRAAVLERLPKA